MPNHIKFNRILTSSLLIYSGPRCDTEITVTIASSVCSRPLEGVYIWESWNSKLINSSGGVYTLRVCRLPVTIYIWKYGFRFTWRIVRNTTENVILQCTGKHFFLNLKPVLHFMRSDYEPHREKTGFLPMRKQRRRSASR